MPVFLSFDSLATQDLLKSADLADELQPGCFQLVCRKCLGHVAVKEAAGPGKIVFSYLVDKALCYLLKIIHSVHVFFPSFFVIL
jgi:hypothetical protein